MSQQEFITHLQDNTEGLIVSISLLQDVYEYTDPLIDKMDHDKLSSIAIDFVNFKIAGELCLALLTNLFQIRYEVKEQYVSLMTYTEQSLLAIYTKEQVESIFRRLKLS